MQPSPDDLNKPDGSRKSEASRPSSSGDETALMRQRIPKDKIVASAELLEASGWCVALCLDDDELWIGPNAKRSLGRHGFCDHPDTAEELDAAFHKVPAAARFVHEANVRIWKEVSTPVAVTRQGSLTKRESEVLSMLGIGKTSPEIAIILGCAPRTVEKHVENIYRKLGVRNRASIILEASTGKEAP